MSETCNKRVISTYIHVCINRGYTTVGRNPIQIDKKLKKFEFKKYKLKRINGLKRFHFKQKLICIFTCMLICIYIPKVKKKTESDW